MALAGTAAVWDASDCDVVARSGAARASVSGPAVGAAGAVGVGSAWASAGAGSTAASAPSGAAAAGRPPPSSEAAGGAGGAATSHKAGAAG
ncbi:hypothetical protein D3C80_1360480 [compost metagenome]